MSHLDIEAMTIELKRIADASSGEPGRHGIRWMGVLSAIEQVHRNVGRRLMPPIDEATAHALEAHVNTILELLDGDLATLITVARRPESGDETIVECGESALAKLAAQAEFSRYYFDESVHRARLQRPVNEFEGELAAMEKRWSECKRAVIEFLSRVGALIKAAEPQ